MLSLRPRESFVRANIKMLGFAAIDRQLQCTNFKRNLWSKTSLSEVKKSSGKLKPVYDELRQSFRFYVAIIGHVRQREMGDCASASVHV